MESLYPIDISREYLIGISAGGGGCYVTLADRPQRWAAAVPIAAVCDKPSLPKIHNVPIWLIHGVDDETVPLTHSEIVFNHMQENGSNIRYTRVQNWKHGPWEPVFNDDNGFTDNYIGGDVSNKNIGLYTWLFSFARAHSPCK
ncbi:hypothetical protein MLD52_22335, partial [Puniceicoccaceae bacterium K14]|nr:hypothetical protein [Puniceicoccaceae bacterium K14]